MSIISINGTPIHDPKEFSVTIQDFDSESSGRGNTADGKMFRERITTKLKIELTYSALNMSEVSTILQAISPVFISVTFPNPYTGTVDTKSMYAGDKTMPMYSCVDGIVKWEGLSFSLIEQ